MPWRGMTLAVHHTSSYPACSKEKPCQVEHTKTLMLAEENQRVEGDQEQMMPKPWWSSNPSTVAAS
jgi:hypothetical protein